MAVPQTWSMRPRAPKRIVGGLVALSLAVGGLAVSAGAQTSEVDELVTDGVAAFDRLVSKEGGYCSLKDAADDETSTDTKLGYVLCDDGLVPSGGGGNGIPVPVAYRANAGNDWSRLPLPASAEDAAALDATYDLQPEDDGRRITIDVDVTLPVGAGIAREYGEAWPRRRAPKGGWPLIVFMHGCCGGHKGSWEAATVDAAGESWHQSNAWFAARGFVVLNYTARGFRNGNDQGSTGTTQLDSRRFEINDYQHLVALMVDHDAQRRAEGLRAIFNINPRKVATVGGSYGGGFSWLALTDPTWRSPVHRKAIRLRAAVPRYGWTDLVEALVPSGHYFDRDPETGRTKIPPTNVAKALSRTPMGVQKQSIVTLLYSSGNATATNHTTFPEWLHDGFARLQSGEPYDGDQQMEFLVDEFLRDRSAYYQTDFWRRVRNGLKVPIYAPVTWTDPLFTTMQSGLAFYNKLRRINRDYPITLYLGDYQHFVANKAKEWNDLCGNDHHVCTLDDYKRSDGSYKFRSSAKRVRSGATTRMNKFLDFYLYGTGTRPARNVTATTTICAANATERYPADEPGIEYRAGAWRKLAPNPVRFAWEGGGVATTTTSSTILDGHASEGDPAFRFTQADKCFTTSNEPGLGVVQYEQEIKAPFTMMGLPLVRLTHETDATDYWIAARLFDRDPDGVMTMVTRGVCKVNGAALADVDCSAFDLWGNAWSFESGHTLVLEVTQADTPTFRRNNFPSTISFSEAAIELPVASERRRRDFRG